MLKKPYYYFWEKQHFLNKKTASNEEQKSFWEFRNTQEHFKPENYLKEKEDYHEIWDYLLKELDLKGKIVYDYGCGGGVWSKRLRDKGAYVIGVDYARSNQELCNEFIHADIKQFRASKKADLINCCRVLIHMTHFEQE